MEPLNGVFIELSTDEEGALVFHGGYEFEDGVSEDYIEYMTTLLAGIYGVVSTQTENVFNAGLLVKSSPGYSGFEVDQEDGPGVEFTPDENLVKKTDKNGDGTVIDFDLSKFSTKNKRKH